MDLIKRFDNYTDSLMPRWFRDSLITFIIFCFSFYYFYGEITQKWRFFGNAIISFTSLFVIVFVVSLLAGSFSKRMLRTSLENVCREIGIDCDSNNDEDIKKYRNHLIKKYSSEKFVNRITDVIGILILVISIPFQAIVSMSMIFMIFYFPIKGYYSDELVLWIPVFCNFILFVSISIIFFFCKVLFNRYPCEAKMYNRGLRESKG